jgi:hypothetical protein
MVNHKTPTSSLEKEEITIDFYLNAQSKKTDLSTNINLKSINISSYEFLPDFITGLEVVPSDGLRLFVNNNLVSWAEIYQTTVKKIEGEIKNKIETEIFNQSLNLISVWDADTTNNCITPYDVEEMNNEPSAILILKDSDINLLIENMPSNALFGLVNAGATANLEGNSINFGEELKNIGYDYNITLEMPNDILLEGKNSYTWNENKNFSGEILSENAPYYQNEDMNSIIEKNQK